MSQARLILTVIVICLTASAVRAADPSVATMPPVVVKTVPQSGDTNVDPSLTEIHVTFSKDMADGSWSWTQISDETFPTTTGKPYYLPDKRTCVLPVKLAPGRSYVTWLNSAKFGNFQDTGRRSAVPYLLVFETGKGGDSEPAPQADIPADAVPVSHVGDTTTDKRSLGGSGHAIGFERPEGTTSVVGVQIFASRYGYPEPPAEDFHVYLMDRDRTVIKKVAFPYSTVERTRDMKWYTLPFPKVEVPEQFYVAISFNPHRTKGIYLGLDKSVTESHSYIGLPDRGFTKVTDGYDWMVRAHLVP